MFDINEHVPFAPSVISTTETELVAPLVNNNKDILVKICLSLDEGLSPEDGRYTTFYNMYFINKHWVSKVENLKKIPQRFDSFVIADYPGDASIFSGQSYTPETLGWLRTHLKDYYFLFPITTVRKGVWKFNGVHIPKSHTNRGYGNFEFRQNNLTVKALCFGGAWKNSMSDYGGSLFRELENTTGPETLIKKKEDTVATWVYNEMQCLSASLAQ